MKIFIILATFLLSSAAMANEVMFVNKSSRNPIDVKYQFCKHNIDNQQSCGSINLSVVNQKSHFITAPPPDSDLIMIISAIEKDQSGNVVSQGRYQYKENGGSHCGYPLKMIKNSVNNAAVIFDDLEGSQAIICDAKGYY